MATTISATGQDNSCVDSSRFGTRREIWKEWARRTTQQLPKPYRRTTTSPRVRIDTRRMKSVESVMMHQVASTREDNICLGIDVTEKVNGESESPQLTLADGSPA
jgi:hypothetical protein